MSYHSNLHLRRIEENIHNTAHTHTVKKSNDDEMRAINYALVSYGGQYPGRTWIRTEYDLSEFIKTAVDVKILWKK